jgi:hypothetical protein
VIARYGLPQLLDRPFGGGMFSDVDANDAARCNLHDYQYIKEAEPHRHRHKEVTGQDSRGVVLQEGVPIL